VNRRILSIGASCAWLALSCVSAWAQATPALKEVVVTATRVDSSVLDSPSSISVISAQQIADSRATDVAQVINGQPGVVVNDYGPTGALKTVSLRGSTSSQVLVLLDGIRLNSSVNGEVDLSSIPMEMIDHIEIVRGGESSLYGSSAIGGVINIITKKAEKPSIALSITNGSYIPHAANTVSPSLTTTPVAANLRDLVDSQDVSLSMEGKVGSIGLNGGGSFTRAANGFTWDDPAVINDWRQRTNADTMAGSGFAGIRAPLLGGELSAKGIFQTSDTGAPGTVLYPNDTARQTDSSASAALAWKSERFLADGLTMDLKGFYRYDELGYNDPSFPPASLHKTQTASIDATQKLSFSERAAVVYGGSASYDSVDSTNYSTLRNRLNLAGFLSVPLSPLENLTITPTARYDYYSDFSGSLSFSLSAVLLLGDESSLRTSFGSGYRVPTLDELYWYGPDPAFPIYSQYGNLSLKPETSYNWEAGWSLQTKMVSVDTAVFTRLLFDGISAIWPYNPALPGYSPVNISQSLLPGAEVHGKLAVTDRISVEATYTFIYSLLLQYAGVSYRASDNLRVPYVPLHNISASVKYADKQISASVDVQYVGEKFTDFANTRAFVLPGYFLANADFRLSLSDKMAFTLGARNILNALYYTVSGGNTVGYPFDPGYPMPPFSILTGMSLKL
jgi:vitamin B12 transporter